MRPSAVATHQAGKSATEQETARSLPTVGAAQKAVRGRTSVMSAISELVCSDFLRKESDIVRFTLCSGVPRRSESITRLLRSVKMKSSSSCSPTVAASISRDGIGCVANVWLGSARLGSARLGVPARGRRRAARALCAKASAQPSVQRAASARTPWHLAAAVWRSSEVAAARTSPAEPPPSVHDEPAGIFSTFN